MNDVRYHGLDGLRAFAMLLGIVLHATLPYFALGAWPQNSYFVYGDNFSESGSCFPIIQDERANNTDNPPANAIKIAIGRYSI